jgi:DNA-binding LytR/AlgR family response regulator
MDILIVEDEPLAARRLTEMIERRGAGDAIVDTLPSVRESVAFLRKEGMPSLIFLDIHLLDGSGFDILREMAITCPVILTTAYDEYALDAFRLHSIAYLLKPIQYEELLAAFGKLDELRKQLSPTPHHLFDQLTRHLRSAARTNVKQRFLVKTGSRMRSLPTSEIACFVYEDQVSLLIDRGGHRYPLPHSLDELEGMLDPDRFFRVNRQMIIAIDAVGLVHKYFNGRLKVDLAVDAGAEVFVSSRRVGDFQAWLDR